jgi:hypothetical protein
MRQQDYQTAMRRAFEEELEKIAKVKSANILRAGAEAVPAAGRAIGRGLSWLGKKTGWWGGGSKATETGTKALETGTKALEGGTKAATEFVPLVQKIPEGGFTLGINFGTKGTGAAAKVTEAVVPKVTEAVTKATETVAPQVAPQVARSGKNITLQMAPKATETAAKGTEVAATAKGGTEAVTTAAKGGTEAAVKGTEVVPEAVKGFWSKEANLAYAKKGWQGVKDYVAHNPKTVDPNVWWGKTGGKMLRDYIPMKARKFLHYALELPHKAGWGLLQAPHKGIGLAFKQTVGKTPYLQAPYNAITNWWKTPFGKQSLMGKVGKGTLTIPVALAAWGTDMAVWHAAQRNKEEGNVLAPLAKGIIDTAGTYQAEAMMADYLASKGHTTASFLVGFRAGPHIVKSITKKQPADPGGYASDEVPVTSKRQKELQEAQPPGAWGDYLSIGGKRVPGFSDTLDLAQMLFSIPSVAMGGTFARPKRDIKTAFGLIEEGGKPRSLVEAPFTVQDTDVNNRTALESKFNEVVAGLPAGQQRASSWGPGRDPDSVTNALMPAGTAALYQALMPLEVASSHNKRVRQSHSAGKLYGVDDKGAITVTPPRGMTKAEALRIANTYIDPLTIEPKPGEPGQQVTAPYSKSPSAGGATEVTEGGRTIRGETGSINPVGVNWATPTNIAAQIRSGEVNPDQAGSYEVYGVNKDSKSSDYGKLQMRWNAKLTPRENLTHQLGGNLQNMTGYGSENPSPDQLSMRVTLGWRRTEDNGKTWTDDTAAMNNPRDPRGIPHLSKAWSDALLVTGAGTGDPKWPTSKKYVVESGEAQRPATPGAAPPSLPQVRVR